MNSINKELIQKLFEEIKEKYENVETIHFDGNEDFYTFSGTLTSIRLDDNEIVFTLLDQDDNYYDISYDDIKDCDYDVAYREFSTNL